MGTNSDYRLENLPRVLRRIGSFAHHTGQEVRLIGWSLGGFLAREAARERPDWVRQVITLGTPVVGGPKYTIAAHRFFRRGIDLDAIEAELAQRNQILLRKPVTAIYSRVDAIVAWQACIDRDTPDVEHCEVRTSHYGFGFSPDVYKLIAKKLLKDDPPSELTADRRHETKTQQ
jgi:pimeloyl-ACP methyl ester carboxylesterase